MTTINCNPSYICRCSELKKIQAHQRHFSKMSQNIQKMSERTVLVLQFHKRDANKLNGHPLYI